MAEYDQLRLENEKLLAIRKKEIYESIPRCQEIDSAIADLSFSFAKEIILSNVSYAEISDRLKNEINTLSLERASLLAHAGYPDDYLSIKYSCPDCKDTGYIGNSKCHCLTKKIIDSLYESSNIKAVLETENFSTYTDKYYSDEIKPAMARIYDYSKSFVENFNTYSGNVLFWGRPGCGKTFMSNCIAKELLDNGKSVMYFTAYHLFELIAQKTFSKGVSEDLLSMDDFLGCDLLIIDDLGSETVNSFTVSQLFLILNERNLSKKSTIISTNLDIQQLKDIYSERSVSRIIGNYDIFEFSGKDIRLQKRL